MANTSYLKITAPNGIVYEGKVYIVTLKTPKGYIGLQPNRSPLFSSIEIGTLKIETSKSDTLTYYIGGGIVYADQHKINIITDDIIDVKKIDIERAKKDAASLTEAIKSNKDTVDLALLETKLKKALFRVDTYNLFNK
ncbi:ATP synthase F1 subunit epsilon [Mycoplasma sp. 394]|uniref:ATP synthase F1 subunit epsilon n=1 Tax=Mycoplasma sp. 6243 TaxID=3440865 RepID=UPI003EC08CD6